MPGDQPTEYPLNAPAIRSITDAPDEEFRIRVHPEVMRWAANTGQVSKLRAMLDDANRKGVPIEDMNAFLEPLYEDFRPKAHEIIIEEQSTDQRLAARSDDLFELRASIAKAFGISISEEELRNPHESD